jgi:hypothetical protein
LHPLAAPAGIVCREWAPFSTSRSTSAIPTVGGSLDAVNAGRFSPEEFGAAFQHFIEGGDDE